MEENIPVITRNYRKEIKPVTVKQLIKEVEKIKCKETPGYGLILINVS